MLAGAPPVTYSGTLTPEVHFPQEQFYGLLDFIAAELPVWRDDTDREHVEAEVRLTEQLCSHLNDAARLSPAWSYVKFQPEISQIGRRKLDMGALPSNAVLLANGRRHTKYDVLLPIECKRLPTPTDNNRDEREYVITRDKTAGGIQRFKLGAHAPDHPLAGMIGYVQAETFDVWESRMAGWIRDLAKTDTLWQADECPKLVKPDAGRGIATYQSKHRRRHAERKLGDVELRHLWVDMTFRTNL